MKAKTRILASLSYASFTILSMGFVMSASAAQNACVFELERAVYSFTRDCKLSYIVGDGLWLTYKNEAIDSVEECTADMAGGPMALETVMEIGDRLAERVQPDSNGSGLHIALQFDYAGGVMDSQITMVDRGAEESGALAIDEIADSRIFIAGDLRFDLRDTPKASFGIKDATALYQGKCVGSYFR